MFSKNGQHDRLALGDDILVRVCYEEKTLNTHDLLTYIESSEDISAIGIIDQIRVNKIRQ